MFESPLVLSHITVFHPQSFASSRMCKVSPPLLLPDALVRPVRHRASRTTRARLTGRRAEDRPRQRRRGATSLKDHYENGSPLVRTLFDQRGRSPHPSDATPHPIRSQPSPSHYPRRCSLNVFCGTRSWRTISVESLVAVRDTSSLHRADRTQGHRRHEDPMQLESAISKQDEKKEEQSDGFGTVSPTSEHT